MHTHITASVVAIGIEIESDGVMVDLLWLDHNHPSTMSIVNGGLVSLPEKHGIFIKIKLTQI